MYSDQLVDISSMLLDLSSKARISSSGNFSHIHAQIARAEISLVYHSVFLSRLFLLPDSEAPNSIFMTTGEVNDLCDYVDQSNFEIKAAREAAEDSVSHLKDIKLSDKSHETVRDLITNEMILYTETQEMHDGFSKRIVSGLEIIFNDTSQQIQRSLSCANEQLSKVSVINCGQEGIRKIEEASEKWVAWFSKLLLSYKSDRSLIIEHLPAILNTDNVLNSIVIDVRKVMLLRRRQAEINSLSTRANNCRKCISKIDSLKTLIAF